MKTNSMQITLCSVLFFVSMAGIVVATILLLSIGPQAGLLRTGLLTMFILGCITLFIVFFHSAAYIKRIRQNQRDLQSDYMELSQRVALLQEQNEGLSTRNSQLQNKIKDAGYPLEKSLNSVLLLLNDIYLECNAYGESYSAHLKKRISYILDNQGYEFLDYDDENLRFYSVYESNYEVDTVTQPALINKKTGVCVIPGIVFLRKS